MLFNFHQHKFLLIRFLIKGGDSYAKIWINYIKSQYKDANGRKFLIFISILEVENIQLEQEICAKSSFTRLVWHV